MLRHSTVRTHLITSLALTTWAQAPAQIASQVPRRPNVVGRTLAEADSLLRRLQITVVSRDSFVPGGRGGLVLRQSPVGGTPVIRRQVDTLIVSRVALPNLVDVPNVVGDPYFVAIRRLRAAQLLPLGPEVSAHDSMRARIIGQRPIGPGQAPPGSSVLLRIRLGDRVRVPSVIGRDTSSAREALARAQLVARDFVLEFDDQFAPGVVTHQDPAPGDSVPLGAPVRLRVSRGPHPETAAVVVPAVVGLGLAQARVALDTHRLALGHVDTVRRVNASGLVAHQDPHGGSPAHVGDAVDLTIAVQPPAARVPNLTGLSRSRAEDTLGRIGLAIGPVGITNEPSGLDGVVVDQSVPPGTWLPLGEPVGFDVNLRPLDERVTVPDVRGLTHQRAIDSLLRSRLSLGHPSYRPDTAGGIVLDQSPKAGQRVAPGFPVSLVIGRDPTVQPDRPRESLLPVPSVVDSALSRAISMLHAAGLRSVIVDSAPVTGRAIEWVVMHQQPGADERVLPGTLIWLDARAVSTVPVPRLVGLSQSEAEDEAGAEGFALEVVERTRALRLSAGPRVVRQSPAHGELALAGTAIAVGVSLPYTHPVPPVLALGVAGVAVAVALMLRPEVPRPAGPKPILHTTIDAESPEVAWRPDDELVQTEITFTVQCVSEEPELDAGTDDLVEREEDRHG